MSRSAFALALVALSLSSLAGLGCRSIREVRKPAPEAPAAGFQNTIVDYVDSDGFDGIFETALVNRDAVITVRTPNERPDWTGRLNAWIAAWTMGKSGDARRFRGQIPFSNIDGDTLREFRLLVNSVVDRAEDASKASVQWFREERIRSHRIELLKPYNLRFYMNGDGRIHLIFFHGDHSRHYQEFLATITDCNGDERWTRDHGCLGCKKMTPVLQNDE